MSLHKAMNDLKFDKRLVERNLANGEITKEDLKKYLETLPDQSENVDIVKLDPSEQRH